VSWIKADSPTEQKHFNYLEELRQSGVTNMFGAGPYLRHSFPRDFPPKEGFHDKAAGEALGKWMKLHGDPARVLPSKPISNPKKRKGAK
jgi:hypothetical protein